MKNIIKKKRPAEKVEHPCICVTYTEPCRASVHRPKKMDPATFVDSTGMRIASGDLVSFFNPKVGGKPRVHEALVTDGDCWLRYVGNVPWRRVRAMGWKWRPQCWTIVPPSSL